MSNQNRRKFLTQVGGGLLAGASSAVWLPALPGLRAEEPEVTPNLVRLRPEMEAVVRWIERTPRDEILRVAAEHLRNGLPYRSLLGGLFLAGIRNIQPRPVGFKFHAVMVVESAHQLGLDSPQSDRLLPLFWALDNFKGSQEQDRKEGDWSLGPVKESSVPSPTESKRRFVEAMERWDDEAADAAVAGLCRSAGSGEVLELLYRYGARDWQNIGHKVIFTAHAVRTLHTIGWEHAEPVLRSLVFALLNGGAGETSAVYTANLRRAESIRADWINGKPDAAATTALLGVLREATPDGAAQEAARALENGVAAGSLWDAVLLAAGELLVRKPGIVALHALTASNGLHHVYRTSAYGATRLLALLQACSWIALYREGIRGRDGGLPEGPRIDTLERADESSVPKPEAILQDLTRDRALASRRILGLIGAGDSTSDFFDAVRRVVLTRGTDAHDYKYASALFEEARAISPSVRGRLLASGAFQLRGASEPESPLIARAREALAMSRGF